MLNVTITYKSGKIETIQLAFAELVPALEQLADEGRVAGIEVR